MSNPLKIIFAGTPDFAATILKDLLSVHEVIAVYTQPDRPAGRGRKVTKSAVKVLAEQQQIPIFQPASLKDVTAQQELASLQADVMIVAAYGLLLPASVLTIPTHGCINVHGSLLPRWRGAAPIQRAILAGDVVTGITIMQMAAGLDTGPMLLKSELPITHKDTTESLQHKLAHLGGTTLLAALDLLLKKQLHPELQNDAQAIYAKKILKSEAKINWQDSALQIDRQVRAFNPWPVAFAELGDQMVRIWETEVLPESVNKAPGTILNSNADGITIATGEGALRLTKLQLPGGRVLPARDVLNASANLFTVNTVLN